MKVAIFAVGTELLFGQTVNTNAVYLSKELNIMGFDVLYHFTVGDNYERLRESVEYALKDCDILITTGGLGPTQDDLTKELLADMFDDQLVLHQPSLEHIKKLFDRMHFEMTENNIKQAYLPQNGIVLKNEQGTAPGCIFMNCGKYAICLPGPHREMIGMFEKEVRRYLEKWNDGAIYYRLVRTFGIGESQMETELLDIIDGQSDPTVATYAKEGECYVRVASKRSTKEAAERAVFEMIEKIRERIGEFIYDIDNRDLPQVVGEKLIERSITISCAESCTGGLFAEKITEIPGISAVFDRGFVTYSNEAKMSLLGVSGDTLDAFGAVSEETALEMVEGVRKNSGSDICVSVTGIAGPDGGTEKKPVGLIYIGASYRNRTVCKKVQMRDVNRNWNRNYSMLQMFDVVNRLVDERPVRNKT